MQLVSRTNTVISGGGIGEDSGFSIDVNAKMFRVLSDTMYQDKVGSMVRELSCNAMDAHIMAGKDSVPFTIHVPDSLEPWFSVKDEGTGLSDQDLRTMYTTYGRSTKDSNNDVVGAFGLGSKTPFAYTDQFTVTSVHDGMKRIYVAVMNDAGLPVLKLQGEAETSEHPGLEINVSVRDTDYRAFHTAITNQLQFFAVKPVLVNNRHQVAFPNLTDHVSITKDGITIYNGDYNAAIDGIWIVQGGVGYSLNADRLGNMTEAAKDFTRAIERKGAILEFNIGDIEVTASREGISYTDTVKARIVKRLTDAANTIAGDALAEIQKLDTVWERAAFYNIQMDVIQKAIHQSAGFNALFPGTSMNRGSKMIIEAKPLTDLGYKAAYFVKYVGRARGWNGSEFTKLIRKTVSSDNNLFHDSVVIYPEKNVHVFVKDTNSKPVARIKAFAQRNNYPSLILIESGSPEVTDADIAVITKALALPVGSVKRLSTIEAPKTVRNSGQDTDARPKAYMMPTNKSASANSSKEWEEVFDTIDEIGEAIWVSMERHNISVGLNQNVRLILEANRHGMLDIPVIAVNNQTAERIKAGKIGEELIAIEDAAIEMFKSKVGGMITVFRAIAKYESFIRAMGVDNNAVQQAAMGGFLPKVDAVVKRMGQLRAKVKGWEWAQPYLNINLDPAVVSGKAAGNARREAVLAKYPLLRHLSPYQTIDMQHIEDYIKLVDARG